MNKDNALFAVIGILFGFISGYLLHEVMAARQPPRLRPGDVAAAAAMGGGEAADAGSPGEPGGGPAGQTAPAAGPAAGAPMAAIQQLKDNVAKNPNDADAILKLANANFDIGRWEGARDLYVRYIKLRPDQPDIISDLGITYRNLGQLDQALAQFAAAEKLAPDHWQARYNQAVVLGIDMKRYDESLKILAELEKLQPGNPQVQKLTAEVERRKKAA